MFYDKFKELCENRGVSVTRALNEIGLSRALGTKWKKTGATPNGETLIAIAEYFDVPIDFFMRGTLPGAMISAMKSIPGYVDPVEELANSDKAITFDDFTYAMHGASGDLTERDKQLLLDMANQLAAANRERKKNASGENPD